MAEISDLHENWYRGLLESLNIVFVLCDLPNLPKANLVQIRHNFGSYILNFGNLTSYSASPKTPINLKKSVDFQKMATICDFGPPYWIHHVGFPALIKETTISYNLGQNMVQSLVNFFFYEYLLPNMPDLACKSRHPKLFFGYLPTILVAALIHLMWGIPGICLYSQINYICNLEPNFKNIGWRK